MFNGLFDLQIRMDRIDKNTDPLAKLDQMIDWEMFRPALQTLRDKPRKSNAGAKGYDVVMMFKALVLQSLYNLSDEQLEYQILDRLSFSRFLGIDLGGKVPDFTTIWLFRESLAHSGLERALFEQFDGYLRDHGFAARKGQIVDASIVQTPRQRNTRRENEQIKAGEADDVRKGWSKAKNAQKDTDARWTKKNGKSFFGYKNHVQADVQHKLIRDYDVTAANVHDSQVFETLLDPLNTSVDVWADSAYRSEASLDTLALLGYREHLQRKGHRDRPLSEREKQGNRTRSAVRSRVEHIFGVQAMKMGTTILRCIGQMRARGKIGLRNLAYNLDRYSMLAAAKG
jgi:IS5 family transposase